MKKFGLLAVAGIAALVLGTSVLGGGQSVQAETTAVVNVHCELVTGEIPSACTTHITEAQILDLATDSGGSDGFVGDGDGTLEASDFDEIEGYDASQISDICTTGVILPDGTLGGGLDGNADFGCTILIFAFVNDEAPVTLDIDSELTSLQAGGLTTDFTCDTDATTPPDTTIGQDDDCSDTIPSNGDGVVVFHVINAAGAAGADRQDEKVVNVRQESIQDGTTLTVVGSPDDIEIVLAEDTISTSGSTPRSNTCASETDLGDAVASANATVAAVTLEDEDNVLVAMWPLVVGIDPPSEDPSVAQLGNNDSSVTLPEIATNTLVTINPGDDLPVGFYTVVCGGSGTGETVVEAISIFTDGSVATADLTVVGFAAANALTAAPAEIECDGSETSTVTATITDAAGNNVANGTEVTFSVVALGTANPINTTTTDGVATSVITPLANSSAGVTVVVDVADGADASTVSIRVDCALPLDTQPPVNPVPTTPVGPISPPDTGNGGYVGQDSGSSLWTMIALAVGAVVVAGGLAARRSSN